MKVVIHWDLKTFLIFVYVPDLKLFKSPCGLSPDDGFETMVPGGIASDSMLPMEGTPSISESCNIGLTFLRVYKANFLINVLIAVPTRKKIFNKKRGFPNGIKKKCMFKNCLS